MPNFRCKEVLLRLPRECCGVKFCWASEEQNGCVLVLAELGASSATGVAETGDKKAAASGVRRCFVQVLRRADHFVCKIDKLSKLSDLNAMQRALEAFKTAFCGGIIDAACALKITQKPAANLLECAEQLGEKIREFTTGGAEIGDETNNANHGAAKSSDCFLASLQNATGGAEIGDKSVNLKSQKVDDLIFQRRIYSEACPPQNPGSAKVHFEIGFGSGRHLLALAASRPQDLVIGAEIHRPSLLQTSRLAAAQQLANVLLLDADARVLAAAMPPRSLDFCYVHFPVPWPNAPQRRVISADFAASLERIFAPGGTLQLRTDEHEYFLYAREIFAAKAGWQIAQKTDAPDICVSKYEARWLRAGKQIYELLASWHGEFCGQESACEINDLRCKKLAITFVKAGGVFAKISRIYSTQEGTLALAHFGAFDAPVSAYLLQNPGSERAQFLLRRVLNTPENAAALALLEEALCH